MKHWATINDPVKMCRYGYGGTDIPAVNMPGIADYLCGHHVLLAHAKVYELYHQEYNPQEDGERSNHIVNHRLYIEDLRTERPSFSVLCFS